MPTTFTLRFNTVDTERAFKRLKEQAPVAITRALNKSAASAKTAMVREISRDTGLASAKVRDRIFVIPARVSTLRDRQVATLTASAKPIPLIDYGASGPEPSRGQGGGVRSKLKGGAKRIPDAFIATMRSGHRGVFRRAGKAGARTGRIIGAASRRRSAGAWGPNLPIVELHGPSLARVFEKHVGVGLARAIEQLQKNLRSEFRFALSQSNEGAQT